LIAVSGAREVRKTSSTPDLVADSSNTFIYRHDAALAEHANSVSGTITYLARTIEYRVYSRLVSVRRVINAPGSLTSIGCGALGNPEILGALSTAAPSSDSGSYTATGVRYSIGRYYDPQTGQFIRIDPLVDQTNAPYAYVNGDPVNQFDPLGLGCGWTDPNPLDCAKAAVEAIQNHVVTPVTNYLSTRTIGVCGELSVGVIAFGQLNGCVGLSGGTPFVMGTAGGGATSFIASATGGVLISNARHPSQLSNWFGFVGASADFGPSVGEQAAFGETPCNATIWESETTAGVGLAFPPPFEAHGGASYTRVWAP
jgi:RHS repeat-associated protein